jgi:hypothetical protein
MRNKFAQTGTYVTAIQSGPASGWMVMAMDDVAAKGIDHAGIMKIKDKVLSPFAMKMFRVCFAAEAPGGQAVFVGDDGQVLTVDAGGAQQAEFVTASARTPQNTGHLRSGARWGDDIVVVGMQRQVYRRTASGVWQDFMQGLPEGKEGDTSGFEAVAAVGPREAYAAGWDGELWACDGTRWRRLDSPTNRIVTALGVAPDGQVYGCGRHGLLFKGRHDAWHTILDKACPDDLWSIVPFKGHVYAASLLRLYRITDDTSLELLEFDELGANSFGVLMSDGETLWSIGAKDVLAFDGQAWSRIA